MNIRHHKIYITIIDIITRLQYRMFGTPFRVANFARFEIQVLFHEINAPLKNNIYSVSILFFFIQLPIARGILQIFFCDDRNRVTGAVMLLKALLLNSVLLH